MKNYEAIKYNVKSTKPNSYSPTKKQNNINQTVKLKNTLLINENNTNINNIYNKNNYKISNCVSLKDTINNNNNLMLKSNNINDINKITKNTNILNKLALDNSKNNTVYTTKEITNSDSQKILANVRLNRINSVINKKQSLNYKQFIENKERINYSDNSIILNNYPVVFSNKDLLIKQSIKAASKKAISNSQCRSFVQEGINKTFKKALSKEINFSPIFSPNNKNNITFKNDNNSIFNDIRLDRSNCLSDSNSSNSNILAKKYKLDNNQIIVPDYKLFSYNNILDYEKQEYIKKKLSSFSHDIITLSENKISSDNAYYKPVGIILNKINKHIFKSCNLNIKNSNQNNLIKQTNLKENKKFNNLKEIEAELSIKTIANLNKIKLENIKKVDRIEQELNIMSKEISLKSIDYKKIYNKNILNSSLSIPPIIKHEVKINTHEKYIENNINNKEEDKSDLNIDINNNSSIMITEEINSNENVINNNKEELKIKNIKNVASKPPKIKIVNSENNCANTNNKTPSAIKNSNKIFRLDSLSKFKDRAYQQKLNISSSYKQKSGDETLNKLNDNTIDLKNESFTNVNINNNSIYFNSINTSPKNKAIKKFSKKFTPIRSKETNNSFLSNTTLKNINNNLQETIIIENKKQHLEKEKLLLISKINSLNKRINEIDANNVKSSNLNSTKIINVDNKIMNINYKDYSNIHLHNGNTNYNYSPLLKSRNNINFSKDNYIKTSVFSVSPILKKKQINMYKNEKIVLAKTSNEISNSRLNSKQTYSKDYHYFKLKEAYFEEQKKLNLLSIKKKESLDKIEKQRIKKEREDNYLTKLEEIKKKALKRKEELEKLQNKFSKSPVSKSQYLFARFEEEDKRKKQIEEEELNNKLLTVHIAKKTLLKPINKEEFDNFSKKHDKMLEELKEKKKVKDLSNLKITNSLISSNKKVIKEYISKLNLDNKNKIDVPPKPDSLAYQKIINEQKEIRNKETKLKMELIYKSMKKRNFSKAVKENLMPKIDENLRNQLIEKIQVGNLRGKSAWIRRRDMLNKDKLLKTTSEINDKYIPNNNKKIINGYLNINNNNNSNISNLADNINNSYRKHNKNSSVFHNYHQNDENNELIKKQSIVNKRHSVNNPSEIKNNSNMMDISIIDKNSNNKNLTNAIILKDNNKLLKNTDNLSNLIIKHSHSNVESIQIKKSTNKSIIINENNNKNIESNCNTNNLNNDLNIKDLSNISYKKLSSNLINNQKSNDSYINSNILSNNHIINKNIIEKESNANSRNNILNNYNNYYTNGSINSNNNNSELIRNNTSELNNTKDLKLRNNYHQTTNLSTNKKYNYEDDVTIFNNKIRPNKPFKKTIPKMPLEKYPNYLSYVKEKKLNYNLNKTKKLDVNNSNKSSCNNNNKYSNNSSKIEELKIKTEYLVDKAKEKESIIMLNGGTDKNKELDNEVKQLLLESIHKKLNILNLTNNRIPQNFYIK